MFDFNAPAWAQARLAAMPRLLVPPACFAQPTLEPSAQLAAVSTLNRVEVVGTRSVTNPEHRCDAHRRAGAGRTGEQIGRVHV